MLCFRRWPSRATVGLLTHFVSFRVVGWLTPFWSFATVELLTHFWLFAWFYGCRAQALSSYGFQYLSEVYLPLKLQEGDWI